MFDIGDIVDVTSGLYAGLRGQVVEASRPALGVISNKVQFSRYDDDILLLQDDEISLLSRGEDYSTWTECELYGHAYDSTNACFCGYQYEEEK